MRNVRTLTGLSSLGKLRGIKSDIAPRKTLLITGKASYNMCGASAVISDIFKPHEYIQFSDFEVNPKFEDGLRGLEIVRDEKVDLILAIGGGSVMDIAKIVKAFLGSPEDCEAVARGTSPVMPVDIPIITVPTTAGSGSEATHFAVVYIGKDKFSLASPHILPDISILDGLLIKSASPYQKAVNGLDAMAQAIEGFWSNNSTEENRDYSLRAIRKLVTSLPRVVSGGTDQDCQNVLEAANLAGQSINISKTTAPHAFSYAFTSYHDISHGHAVWMTLPKVFAYHARAKPSEITDSRGTEYFQKSMELLISAMGFDDDTDIESTMKTFMRGIGAEPEMENLGIKTRKQKQLIIDQVNLQRLKNNPVDITPDVIDYIFDL